ncbi:MAG TPA: hypothetical protein VFD66_07220 [Verrucomicrobiae bacterium]|nr:hypothetical protein [Verrucomicrobiae bacterium]
MKLHALGICIGLAMASACVAASATDTQPEIPPGAWYRFEDSQSFPTPFRDAAAAVMAAVEKNGLKPAMYFIRFKYGPGRQILTFELWDVRAFPLDSRRVGNPGGECRTIEYNSVEKMVTRIYGWR